MKKHTCKICRHQWTPRTDDKPKACPKCKRYDWNKKIAIVFCSLLLTTSAFAGSVEQAKAEIEKMELTGVSVKTTDLKSFTEDQKERIQEAISELNAQTQTKENPTK